MTIQVTQGRSAEELSGVSLLGNQHTEYPTDYAPQVLESFQNKHGDSDYVVSFDEDTPQRLISHVLPNILVKGGDYKVEEIAGHKEVQANGGKVIIIPFVDGCSTTNIVKKIKCQKD